MSRLSFNCPQCGELFTRVKAELFGRKFQCKCGKVFRVGNKEDRLESVPVPETESAHRPEELPLPSPVEPLPAPMQLQPQGFAPQAQAGPSARRRQVRGVRASGRYLRIGHNAVLPMTCIKTGMPATRTLTKRYHYSTWGSIFSIIIGFVAVMLRILRAVAVAEGEVDFVAHVIEAFIVAMIVFFLAVVVFPRRIKVELPLSEDYYVRQQAIAWTLRAILGTCLIMEVIGLTGVVFREQLTESQEMMAGALMMLPAMVIVVFGLLYPRVTRVIRTARITDTYGEFTGAHPEFMKRLAR